MFGCSSEGNVEESAYSNDQALSAHSLCSLRSEIEPIVILEIDFFSFLLDVTHNRGSQYPYLIDLKLFTDTFENKWPLDTIQFCTCT